MDPDANLREQRSIVRRIHAINDSASPDGNITPGQLTELEGLASRLAELVEALDEWILGGGFYPEPWRRSDVELSEFLEDCVDYFDDRQDVDAGSPNKAMRLLHAAELLQARYDPEEDDAKSPIP